MVKWFSKKGKNDKTIRYKANDIKRVSSDIDKDILINALDADTLKDYLQDSGSKFADNNYRSEEPEGIEDLSPSETRNVEDFVGSPVVLVHNDHVTKPSFIFANEEEWVVYKSKDEVDEELEKIISVQLRENPEVFDQSWLDQFRQMKMSTENRIMMSQEEARRLTGFAGKAELLSLAKSFGVNLNLYHFDSVDDLREIVYDHVQQELKHQLQDPVEYYVNLEGRYTESQLAKMPWIETSVDYDGAVKDAIELNGRAHFLSTIDGRESHIGDMYLYRLK